MHPELASVLARAMQPLIRYLIRVGYTYPQFIQLVRKLYVDLAENCSDEQGNPPTASRVSLLTGIARRYIRDIRAQKAQGEKAATKWSPGAKLIAEWTTHPRFTDEKGLPLPLSRLSSSANKPSFEALAALASRDIRPRTQLDYLLERELVHVSETDHVHLLHEAYQPDGHEEEMLRILGEHLHDHIAAGTHNMQHPDRFFERSAYQEGLSDASIEQLQAMIKKESMDTLRRVYARAAELAEADSHSQTTDAQQRFRLGIYAYADDADGDKDKTQSD